LPPLDFRFLRDQSLQIAFAALGGLLFHMLGIPAAWLSGSVVATVTWGALGLAKPMPRPLVDAAMLVSGATMGAGVTPEALAAVTRYPLSLAALAVGVVAITGASMLWLTRVSGWRKEDALLASVPGGLSTVLAVAADRKAAVAAISIVQASRLFILVMLLPSVIVFLGGGADVTLHGERQAIASPFGLFVTLLGGLALGRLLEWRRVAAPILLAAMVVSMALHAADWAPGAIPTLLSTGGLVLIGIFIAERFRTIDVIGLRRLVPAALGSFAAGMAVAALFAGLAANLARVGFADALVAFAPGGLEAMMVLALILGLDPLYVGIHHLARFLGIGLALPAVVTWLGRPDRSL
jgi:membrane AbrB-like protein